MKQAFRFWQSDVGKKSVMAVTGLLLFLFVVAHLWGNLKAYEGPEKLNHYAEFLRTVGYPFFRHGQALLFARTGLIVVLILHVTAAIQLTIINRKARPVPYRYRRMIHTDYAARTMIISGPLIALFTFYHLMHLTWGTAHPGFVPGDPYRNMVSGFLSVPAAVAYIAGVLALGFHLHHGLWSFFQSLGFNHPKYNVWRRVFAVAATLVVTAGYLSFPIAVLAGWIR